MFRFRVLLPDRPISVQSSTQITINPNFTMAAHRWSVEVINPGPTSSGQLFFDVVSPTSQGPAEPAGVLWVPSPNFDARPAGQAIGSIVIHTTQGSYESAINRFQNPAEQVSAHYVIRPSGEITQMVALENKAWHATYYNSRSIGLEMVGNASDANTWNTANLEALANIGTGPLELRGGARNGAGSQGVYQQIFDSAGRFQNGLTGTFVYHAEPNHVHFENFAQYNLKAVTGDAGGDGEVVAHSPKTINHYYKFGPSPSCVGSQLNTLDLLATCWYEFRYHGSTGAEILADRVILQLKDGGLGNEEGNANGVIVDPDLPAIVHAGKRLFDARQDFDAGTYPIVPAAGDFNEDGFLDLVVGNQGDTNAGSNAISLLIGN